jgi:hypothetical protein
MYALAEWTKRTRSMRDDEGRPLGESRAAAELLHGVPLELRTCPYTDSRHNNARPMNSSALRQMLAHWEEALGGMALLRSLYRDQMKPERPRLIDVWRIAGLCSFLADFAFLRAWEPVGDRALPAAVAVLYKFAVGVTFTTAMMWEDGAARFDAFVDADSLYQYADRHGHFIGADQVCAGPVALVKEALRLLVDSSDSPGDAQAVAPVIGDGGRFLAFAHGVSSLYLLRSALYRLDAALGLDLARALAADPAAPALPPAVRRQLQARRSSGPDAEAGLDVVDELLACTGLDSRAIREAWSRPLGEAGPPFQQIIASSPARFLGHQTMAALGRHLARFRAVEQGFAELVRRLKGPIAAALGIDPGEPRARQLYLVDYVPPGAGLVRTILREALEIEVPGTSAE